MRSGYGMDPFRNYDAWKTASPYDDCPDEYARLRCSSCGGFLRFDPDSYEYTEAWESDYTQGKRPHDARGDEYLRNVKQIESPFEWDRDQWWSFDR